MRLFSEVSDQLPKDNKIENPPGHLSLAGSGFVRYILMVHITKIELTYSVLYVQLRSFLDLTSLFLIKGMKS